MVYYKTVDRSTVKGILFLDRCRLEQTYVQERGIGFPILHMIIIFQSYRIAASVQFLRNVSVQAKRLCASRSEARIDFESIAHGQGSEIAVHCVLVWL